MIAFARNRHMVLACFQLLLWQLCMPVSAEPAAPLSALAQMPVKEVTVFKDGHAFVQHQSAMPVDNDGNVVMDYLPTPVLGTFWPFSADKQAKLTSVVASQRKVLVSRTSLSLSELLQGNPGSSAQISELRGAGDKSSSITYDADIVGVPTRSSEELEETAPPNSGEKLPEVSNLVMLKTGTGTEAANISKIEAVTFKGNYKTKVAHTEFRNLLTLNLDWAKSKPGKTADVGMMYLQKGMRWIPNYKVNIDGQGNAHIILQATLINELTDLNDVTTHLVIGVPTFNFKDTLDPIALQQTLANLSGFFQEGADNQYANFSNAIMTQMAERRSGEASRSPGGGGPEVVGGGKNEDLYVFTVKHVTLKKGQRMVLPVHDTVLKYKDVYSLDIPFTPPLEIRQQHYQGQQGQLEKLFRAPKFMHQIRLTNSSDQPLTTAPALIFKDNKLMAQGMMTYTARGAVSDLPITTAVDLKVKKTDKETGRTPNAVNWQGYQYGKVDLAGTICVSNFLGKTADLEIRRNVLGKLESADHNGVLEMVNVFEDDEFSPNGGLPDWWRWFSWPDWWTRVNGVGRVTWKMPLENGKSADLSYKWNYYWR